MVVLASDIDFKLAAQIEMETRLSSEVIRAALEQQTIRHTFDRLTGERLENISGQRQLKV
ncbi:hypothetical protein AB1L30_03850 [Bremerella sp. JC817]|uniref:hypothetical protein n=1 Tax=Bremerella sp. JC817 TaxID=3231756 RepID=UPI0034573DE5